jgi:hypothetical protein
MTDGLRRDTCFDPFEEELHICPGRCGCYVNHLCGPGCQCNHCAHQREHTLRQLEQLLGVSPDGRSAIRARYGFAKVE